MGYVRFDPFKGFEGLTPVNVTVMRLDSPLQMIMR